MAATLHNTRILRFLLVLVVVVLTIFIYATYSSTATLQPPMPHHTVSAPTYQSQSLIQLSANRTEDFDSSGIGGGGGVGGGGVSDFGVVDERFANNIADNGKLLLHHNAKFYNKKSTDGAPSIVSISKKHHREPTIDDDANGGNSGSGGSSSGGAVAPNTAGNNVDDMMIPDEAGLGRFDNNDLLDEQYVQNVDNALGNINNSVGNGVGSDTLSVRGGGGGNGAGTGAISPPEQSQSRQQQQQLIDNNLNKIPDSDVLIPTSNLQKFIENADKILKNITTGGQQQQQAPNTPEQQQLLVEKDEKKQQSQIVDQKKLENNFAVAAPKPQLPSNVQQQNAPHPVSPNKNTPEVAQAPAVSANNENNENPEEENEENNEALPPSVIMTIKRPGSGQAAVAPAAASKPQKQPVVASKIAAIGAAAAKTTPKANVTKTNLPIDPTQGILTQQIYEAGHMNEEINIEKICPNSGADLKLLILITSAQSHVDARLSIRQTWGHYGVRRDVSIAFILGRSTNATLNTALTQENFIYGDLIRGHFVDSYNNLTLKTISALEWVDTHCQRAKYLLKTDDDMFINVPKLLSFLDSHSKEKRVIFGRLAKKWKPIRNKKSKYYVSTGQFTATVFPPFTTGPAYVLTNDIIHELYDKSLQQVYLKLEDVFTTGIVAQQLNIKRMHVNEFLNRRIAFNPCNIRKTISVHMIKSNEQFDLWKKLLDQATKCK